VIENFEDLGELEEYFRKCTIVLKHNELKRIGKENTYFNIFYTLFSAPIVLVAPFSELPARRGPIEKLLPIPGFLTTLLPTSSFIRFSLLLHTGGLYCTLPNKTPLLCPQGGHR
jgi:hypothetical protein